MRGVLKTSWILLVSAMVMQAVSAAPKATKEDVEALAFRIERMERALDEQSTRDGNKQGLLTLQRQLKEMERELQTLRDENERLRNDVEQMQTRQREMFIAIDKRLQSQSVAASDESSQPRTSRAEAPAKPAQTQAATPAEETQVATTRPVVISSVTEDSPETTDAYRNAFLLLKQRRHDEAITAFEEFLSNYPSSKYSGNAQYWLAEANYVTKRYDRALVEFQKVLDMYPTSSKVPDARLKMGYTYYELEQWEDARVTLTRLRAQFPNSTVAGLAQQRLERLEREGH